LLAKKPNATTDDDGLKTLYQAILMEKKASSSAPNVNGLVADKADGGDKNGVSNSSSSSSSNPNGSQAKDWGDFFTGDKVNASDPTISNYYAALQLNKDGGEKTDSSSPIVPSRPSNGASITPLSSLSSSIPSILQDAENGKLEPTSSFFSVSKPSAPSTPSTANGYGSLGSTSKKPVIRPNEGYGALASNKPVSSKSDTSPNNSSGGWSAANTKSQQEVMYERFSGNEDDDQSSSSIGSGFL
jgi:hypothetical protein